MEYIARQAPLSVGFSRQEYWSGEPLPSPGDPPNPGIEPRSPTLQADRVPSEPPGKPPEVSLPMLPANSGSTRSRLYCTWVPLLGGGLSDSAVTDWQER